MKKGNLPPASAPFLLQTSVRTCRLSGNARTDDDAPAGGSREAHKASTRLLRGKRLCRTLHTIAYAIRIFRINRVVVGSFRRQLIHAHADNSVVMGWVQPDVRLGSQVQFLGIRAVVHHGKMLGRAARIVAGPSNDGQMLAVQLDLRPLSDFHAVYLF